MAHLRLICHFICSRFAHILLAVAHILLAFSEQVFVPLISAGAMEGLLDLGDQDAEDFVLAEWIMAVEVSLQANASSFCCGVWHVLTDCL